MINSKFSNLILATTIALHSVSSASNFAFNNGDLILGIQAAGGTGNTKNVFVNLGSGVSAKNGVGFDTVKANIGTTLSSVFGANWYTRSDIWFGVLGNLNFQANSGVGSRPAVDGDPSRTWYVSQAASTAGSAALIPASTYVSSSLGSAGNYFSGLEGFLPNLTAQADGSAILDQSANQTEWNNSWTKWNPIVGEAQGASLLTFTGGVQQTFGKTGSETFIDLQRVLAPYPGADPTGVLGGGTYIATVSISSTGAIKLIKASANNPEIAIQGGPIQLNTTAGTPSDATSFTVSGANMAAGISVNAPTGFEVSTSSNASFSSNITVGTSGTIASTPVYVRIPANASSGNYTGNITLSSTGATSKNISVSGTVIAPTPVISVSGNLTALSTTYGTASSTSNFTISGANMTAPITVTPPTGFQVSTSSTDNFSSNLTIQPTAGTIPNTTIHVRLSPAANVGTYSGNISLTSTGATEKTIATASSTISKATSTVTLGSLSATFDGTAKSATATTSPTITGNVTYTYTGISPTVYAQSTTPPTQAGSYTVVGTINDANYGGNATGTLVIAKATPSVTNVTATDINYGSALSSSTLTGTKSTPGTLAFTSPSTTPNAGTANQAWTFTPDESNYSTITGAVSVTVNKATSTLTLGSLSPTFDGSAKSATATTNPTITGNVTYTYTGISPTVYAQSTTPPTQAGSYTVVGTINDANYSGNATGTLVIAKATPSVTNVTATNITYGSDLSNSTLTGTKSTPGTLAFTMPTTTPSVGTANQAWTFTPDESNYSTITGTVNVTVNKATSTVTLGSLSATFDGTAKSATATTSPTITGNVTYTYAGISPTVYDQSSNPPTQAGSYTVVGTINDTNYSGNATGTLVITKATPSITNATATDINYGSALSNSTLNGTKSTPGTLAFTSPTTTPNAGTASQAWTFFPTDSNYSEITGTVNVTVAQATPIITPPFSASPIYKGQTLANSMISGFASVSGNFSFADPSIKPSATADHSVIFTPDSYNYKKVEDLSVSVTVNESDKPAITSPVTASGVYSQSFQYEITATNNPTAFSANNLPEGLSIDSSLGKISGTPTKTGIYDVALTITNTAGNSESTLKITVNKATSTVTLGSLSPTYDGTAKSATATTSPTIAGNVTYTYKGISPTVYDQSSTPPTQAGSYTVVGTINDTNYSGNATGTLVIAKGTPSVTNATATDINYGSALNSSTLTGTKSTPGTLAFTSPSTTPSAGTDNQAWTFTPDDSNYNTVTGTVSVTVNKATSIVTLGSLTPTYDGTAKSATATTSPTIAGNVTYTYKGISPTVYDQSSTPPTQAGSYTVVGTINDTNYSGHATGTLVIAKGTPSVTNATATDINYGSDLSNSTLTGTKSTPGTLAFTSPSTTPNAGTANQAWTFTPDDSNYNTVTGTVSVTVNKATATVTLGNLTPTYDGTAKSATATTSPTIAGNVTYTYTGISPTVYAQSSNPPTQAGSYTVVGAINDANYSGNATGTLVIAKAIPSVTNVTATDINYGSALSGSTLNGTKSTPGTLTFTSPTTTPIAGTSDQAWTFTPDESNYSTITGTVSVTINKATSIVTLGSLTPTYDGTAKSATATTSPTIAGNVTYTYTGIIPTVYAQSSNPPTQAGSYSVVGTINDANYSGTATGTFVIVKATPSITNKPNASNITLGQKLSDSTLNGGIASVNGSFAFTNPNTQPSTAGTSSQSVTFSPADTNNYLTATTSIDVVTLAGSNPVITNEPIDLTVSQGNNATFSVQATGQNLSYQWKRNGVDISNARNSSYTVSSTSIATAGEYSVVVSSDNGSQPVTSRAAKLIVTFPLADLTINENTSPVLSVSVTGTGLKYQWFKDGMPLRGQTNSTLTLKDITVDQAGTYSAEVTDANGNKFTSQSSKVTVNAVLPEITTQPSNVSVYTGGSATMRVMVKGAGHSYQWKKDGVAIQGEIKNTLSLNDIILSDAGDYTVSVTNSVGTVTSRSARLRVLTANTDNQGGGTSRPIITSQPVSQTVADGGRISLSVRASGGGLLYQWTKNRKNITGANQSSYTVPAASAAASGDYAVIVYNSLGTVTSNTARIAISAPEIDVQQPAGSSLVSSTSKISFGTAKRTSAGIRRTFTIRNTGTTKLTGISFSKQGSHRGEFTVTQSNLREVAPRASATFTVTFKPAAVGTRTASIRIASNDRDENPFIINLAGQGAR